MLVAPQVISAQGEEEEEEEEEDGDGEGVAGEEGRRAAQEAASSTGGGGSRGGSGSGSAGGGGGGRLWKNKRKKAAVAGLDGNLQVFLGQQLGEEQPAGGEEGYVAENLFVDTALCRCLKALVKAAASFPKDSPVGSAGALVQKCLDYLCAEAADLFKVWGVHADYLGAVSELHLGRLRMALAPAGSALTPEEKRFTLSSRHELPERLGEVSQTLIQANADLRAAKAHLLHLYAVGCEEGFVDVRARGGVLVVGLMVVVAQGKKPSV